MINLAAAVIVVAAMRAASSLLVPFLLAVFITIIVAPPYYWLKNNRVPTLGALLVVIGVVALAGFLVTVLVSASLQDFIASLPVYRVALREYVSELLDWLNAHGFDVGADVTLSYFDPSKVMGLTTSILNGLSSALTNGFLILITVIFLLSEMSGLPRKMHAAFGNADTSLAGGAIIIHKINRYMGIKAVFSLITGLLIVAWLTFVGVDFPALWGVLAFFLNFIPNIGSIIAAVPAISIALVQLGSGPALLVAAGYIVVNVVIGSLIEPRFMGRGLGLSTLVVFLSLVFWGWVLGPVGMLLSVPLTIAAKICFEGYQQTRWLAILLSAVPRAGATKRVAVENPISTEKHRGFLRAAISSISTKYS